MRRILEQIWPRLNYLTPFQEMVVGNDFIISKFPSNFMVLQNVYLTLFHRYSILIILFWLIN